MIRSNSGSCDLRANRRLIGEVVSFVTSVVLLTQFEVAVAQPNVPILLDAEPTAEGLYPLDPSIMGTAWARPDVDLSQYTRMFATTAVHFRDVPDRWHDARTLERAQFFYIDERRKDSLRRIFRDSFDDALFGARSFERSTELGRDVLLVQAILTDVISGVPPYLAGSAVTNIRWAWETNIVLEIRDSMSDTVLARTVERKRMDGPMDATMVGALTPLMVDDWTRLLVNNLETLRDMFPSRISRLDERSRE